MNAIVINDINVNFEVASGRVFINSLELSKVFNKEHSKILRLINNRYGRINTYSTEILKQIFKVL